MKAHFTALDFFVLIAYLAGTTALGLWIGRKQKRRERLFHRRTRSIPWWAVMFSIVASETSALTFISIPGLAYIGESRISQIVAGYILGRIVVAFVLLPRYYQRRSRDRVRAARAALRTRDAALHVDRIHGHARRRGLRARLRDGDSGRADPRADAYPEHYVKPVAILILGVLTIIYTYHGGMKAVVWTELLQASVYILGGISAVDSHRQGRRRADGDTSSTSHRQPASSG